MLPRKDYSFLKNLTVTIKYYIEFLGLLVFGIFVALIIGNAMQNAKG